MAAGEIYQFVIGEENCVKQKNMEEIAKVLMDSARDLEGARSQTE